MYLDLENLNFVRIYFDTPTFDRVTKDRSVNSLLPVSRYIDTAFADKGSHQKTSLKSLRLRKLLD